MRLKRSISAELQAAAVDYAAGSRVDRSGVGEFSNPCANDNPVLLGFVGLVLIDLD